MVMRRSAPTVLRAPKLHGRPLAVQSQVGEGSPDVHRRRGDHRTGRKKEGKGIGDALSAHGEASCKVVSDDASCSRGKAQAERTGNVCFLPKGVRFRMRHGETVDAASIPGRLTFDR